MKPEKKRGMRQAEAELNDVAIEQGPTTRLAEFATNLSYDEFGPELVQHAKECLLDYLRLAALGASTPWAQAVYGLVKPMGGAPESRISMYGDRVPMVHAALVHGTFSHGLERSDSHLSKMRDAIGLAASHCGGLLLCSKLLQIEFRQR